MASYAYGRVVLGGTLGAADSWSTSFAFSGADVVSPAALQAALNDFSSDAHDWWTGGSPSISATVAGDTYLGSIRAYYYEAGSTTADTVAEYVYSSPINGGSTEKLSARDAMVVTLLTGHPGRSYKGRMYIPCNGATLTDHQFSNTDVTNVATATADLLTAWNALTSTGISVAAVAGKTALTVISQTRCDSIPDTIRARSRKMVSLHTNAQVVS